MDIFLALAAITSKTYRAVGQLRMEMMDWRDEGLI